MIKLDGTFFLSLSTLFWSMHCAYIEIPIETDPIADCQIPTGQRIVYRPARQAFNTCGELVAMQFINFSLDSSYCLLARLSV